MLQTVVICAVLCTTTVFTMPSDLVATSESPPANKELESSKTTDLPPQIYDMKVETNVSNRFAKTVITSKVRNPNTASKEVTFSVVLPEKAFISEFVMEIAGKSYKAHIKEKEEAKKTYDNAVSQGQSAAHVSVSARDSNRFTVSVNVEPEQKAIFYLTYEELLDRRLDKYEVVLNIQPGQPVKELAVQVNINETRPLKFVRSPALRTGNEVSKNQKDNLDPNADIKIIDKTSAVVKFHPDIKKQQAYAKELGTDEKNGLAGQFVVEYDVERDPHGGEILLNEGFFVHFFAPKDIPLLPKYVIFILDTSGSMQGIRIQQLKVALDSILSELKAEDKFSLVEFASSISVWDVVNKTDSYRTVDEYSYETPEQKEKRLTQKLPPAYEANELNIKNAKEVVTKLNANGGTNIQEALKVGLKLVEENKQDVNQPLIVFLTDGEATVGEYNNDNIIKTVTALNTNKTPIFTLSFGDGADKAFLEKISLKNQGFARHIYEGADAGLQLEEFYKIISSPLLTNIKFKYVSNVTEVTKTIFPILFLGGELVVTGKVASSPEFTSSVEAVGVGGPIVLKPQVEAPVTSLERLWAYLTVKELLEKREIAGDDKTPGNEALKLALKYSFVTDVTSLVVVKPNDTSAQVGTEDASKLPNRFPGYGGLPGISGGAQAIYGPTFAAPASASFGPPVGYHIAGAGSGFADVGGYSGASAPNFLHQKFASRPSHTMIPQYSTTPFVHSTSTDYTSTTTTLPTSTSEKNENVIFNKLLIDLPWLANILAQNGTLTTANGPLDLGFNSVTDNSPCKLTPTNSTDGICTPLHQCNTVYEKVTSLKVFLDYSCLMGEVTGICCPK